MLNRTFRNRSRPLFGRSFFVLATLNNGAGSWVRLPGCARVASWVRLPGCARVGSWARLPGCATAKNRIAHLSRRITACLYARPRLKNTRRLLRFAPRFFWRRCTKGFAYPRVDPFSCGVDQPWNRALGQPWNSWGRPPAPPAMPDWKRARGR